MPSSEKLARRRKKSRSQLYGEAFAKYLRRHDPEAATEAVDRVCADIGESTDPFVGAAGRRALKAVDW
jgi:hypothetical protein